MQSQDIVSSRFEAAKAISELLKSDYGFHERPLGLGGNKDGKHNAFFKFCYKKNTSPLKLYFNTKYRTEMRDYVHVAFFYNGHKKDLRVVPSEFAKRSRHKDYTQNSQSGSDMRDVMHFETWLEPFATSDTAEADTKVNDRYNQLAKIVKRL
jgi:hypothetical protein